MRKIANQTKSVFLYGKPTQTKKYLLSSTQKEYTNLINHFIEKMISDEKYYLDLFNNIKQSSLIRAKKNEKKTVKKFVLCFMKK